MRGFPLVASANHQRVSETGFPSAGHLRIARIGWTIPQVNFVCTVSVPVGGALEQMLEWSGLSRAQSRCTARHNFRRIYCPLQTIHVCRTSSTLRCSISQENLGALAQYLRTHFRRSAFLFQFLCRDRAPIEMRPRMLPKKAGREARTCHRLGPDRDAAGKKKWGTEVYTGMLNGSKKVSLVMSFVTQTHARGHGVRMLIRHRVLSHCSPLWSNASICSHAATRTGQTRPICTHVRSILVCGFLWG